VIVFTKDGANQNTRVGFSALLDRSRSFIRWFLPLQQSTMEAALREWIPAPTHEKAVPAPRTTKRLVADANRDEGEHKADQQERVNPLNDAIR
jgi:hypothetical protein